jgi:hypothetical protein
MNIIILKTNIPSPQGARRLDPLFRALPGVIRWSVDTEDVDKVLRIEDRGDLTEDRVIGLISSWGYQASRLPD